MEEVCIPWGVVILSAFLWFLLKPLLDPRTYIKIGTTFFLTTLLIYYSCLTLQVCATLTAHSITWTLIYTVIFWPTHPSTSLYISEDRPVWIGFFLTPLVLTLLTSPYISNSRILMYIVVSGFLWNSGGNYMSNRPKSVGFSIMLSMLLSYMLPMDMGSTVSMTIPFILFSLLVYCNMDRCVTIVDTWPALCPGKGFVSDIIYPLVYLKDSELPQQEVEDIKQTFGILYKPKTLTEFIGSIMVNGPMPHGVRLLVAPIAIMMRRLDDMTDNTTSVTEEQALRELDSAKEFFDELFLGREKDWDMGLWPRLEGSPSPKLNLEKYIKSLPSVEPCVLRVVIVTADYIPPRVVYDLLDAFRWERTNGVVTTEEDLLWFSARASGPAGHMVVSAFMSKYNLKPIHVPLEYREQYMKIMGWIGYLGQIFDIATDIVQDSLEGKVFIPKDWMVEEGHYEILKDQRKPFSLGKEMLQVYTNKFLQRVDHYASEVVDNLDPGYLRFQPLPLQRALIYGPTFLKLICAINRDRREYDHNPIRGNYLDVAKVLFTWFYLPIKSSNGWIIL